jgi:nitrogen fixation NifU-like protein
MKNREKELDRLAAELNKEVLDQMRSIYSDQVVKRFLAPKNIGLIENPDGFGRYTGSCGDTMEIFLKVRDERIEQVKFQTDGCGTTIVCGTMATELVEGKKVSQALRINHDKILQELGGLPEEDQHCALIAATAMQMALKDYLAKKREPWKRAYEVN